METATFTYEVGGLLAKTVKRELTSYAWSKDLTVHFEEVGSWLHKAVRVEVRGEHAKHYGAIMYAWLQMGAP